MPDVIFEINGSQGEPIQGAAVLAAYPSGVSVRGQTNVKGECPLHLYRTDQDMTVLVAAEGYLPFHTILMTGDSARVHLKLEPSKEGRKAMLFDKSTGYIPGIEGRLNPHKDGYVYGDNIAINGRLATPAAHFKIGEPLHLVDVYGVETTIRFLVVEGQFSLIEYTEPTAYAGE